MADSTTFPFSIFRLTAAIDTEANIANKEAVGMSIGVDEDFDAGLLSYKPVFDARRTDVGNPDETVPSTPDTGITPPIFELTFMVDERLVDSKMMVRLAIFMLEEKTNLIYDKGRMGIRYDAKSEFNITPAGTPDFSGGKIIHFEFDDDMQWGGTVFCKLLILFNGNPTALLAALDAAAT